MEPEAFYARLAHILDEDHVDATYVLRSSVVWDSLSVLAIVSFVDEACDFPLQVSDLQCLQTAGELLNLLNSHGAIHHSSDEA
jgi:acyl carrier protein